MKRLDKKFYETDAIKLAPLLLGKLLVRNELGVIKKYRITETECYYGEEDTACHAKAGRTKRTSVLYEQGGVAYVYLCYGIHYLFNIVAGDKDYPQGVLIRGVEGYSGPARVTKALNINKDFYGEDLSTSNRIWVEDDGYVVSYKTSKRVGIDYATEPYKSIEWRFILTNEL